MIGFITTPQISQAINDGVVQAQISRGLPVYWLPGKYPVHIGEYSGMVFIPYDDIIRNTILHNGLTPEDFPEFDQLVSILGGLESRINLDPTCIIDPILIDSGN
jgi:hypothetical protein